MAEPARPRVVGRGHAGKGRLLLLLLLVLVGGGALLTAGLAFWLHRPLDPQGVSQTFRVEPGEAGRAVVARLTQEGLIGRWEPLLLYARLTGADRQIQPGRYEFSPADRPIAILEGLATGQVILQRVTIPEGFTASAILDRLAERLELPRSAFEEAAGDTAWCRTLGLPPAFPEGYLFPETYLLDPAVGSRRILGELIGACVTFFGEQRVARAAELGMSRHEVLTLASIIEAETARADERARISAVYHNRLRRGRLLQADPTVAYGVGRPGRPLALEDLESPSAYNTYVHPGLPPGPICSPGAACIDAALWPLEDCHDLYFVARGDGSHIFSQSLEAHERAKAAVRRRR